MKNFDPQQPMTLWAAKKVRELVARRRLLAEMELRQMTRRERRALALESAQRSARQ
jgi:hypothetical protein